MSTTIWGSVGRIGDVADHRDRYDRIVDAHSFDSVDLNLGGTRIDLGHDPKLTVGEVIYAELTDQDRIMVVGVVDGLALDEIDQPVYMSGEYEMRGDVHQRIYRAREAQLLSVGLTLAPATHAALPIKWRAGDVRSSLDRFSWPVSWGSTTPLLQRSVEWRQGMRERSAPERIVDRRKSEVSRLVGRQVSSLAPHELYALGTQYERPPGAMRYGPPGKVLRVS